MLIFAAMTRKATLSIWAVMLLLLFGCGADRQDMLRRLETLEAWNRADSVMQNDSLAEQLVDYFDRHGSPNERMRARYMLGRTYYDLGELPRALETYLEAAGCADTTAADCDYKVLSRIHAQSAEIYNSQIQPHSQVQELRTADFYAKKGKDTLMAIECYSELAYVYKTLNIPDSVIFIAENAARMFREVHEDKRSAQCLGGAITSLVEKGNLEKAKQYIEIYEQGSGFFDADSNIEEGREIYYYAKGRYYLAIQKVDSAEVMFRRLMKYSSLNDRIAGSKGLQGVYERKRIPDSLAKYANIAYVLNDSAYSISEMHNLQKIHASYSYTHKQLLAEQETHRADRLLLVFIVFSSFVLIGILMAIYFINDYKEKKNKKILQYHESLERLEKTQTELLQLRSQEKQETLELISSKDRELMNLQALINNQLRQKAARLSELESKLDNSDIAERLHGLLKKNPPQQATSSDFKELRSYMNEVIPSFYSQLNTPDHSLRLVEYNVCLLTRFHFKPSEISKLTGLKDNHVANIRKSILLKVFGIVGPPKALDEILLRIKE